MNVSRVQYLTGEGQSDDSMLLHYCVFFNNKKNNGKTPDRQMAVLHLRFVSHSQPNAQDALSNAFFFYFLMAHRISMDVSIVTHNIEIVQKEFSRL